MIAISVFWFGVSFFWAGMLTLVLQERVAEFIPKESHGAYLGVLAAGGALFSTVVELIAGPYSDRCRSRWGRRRPFIFHGVIWCIPFIVLFTYSGSFWQLMVCFAAIQFFLNWANGPYQAVIPDVVPPHRHGLASSYMGAMTLLGTGLGLALVGALLDKEPMLLSHWSADARMRLVGWVYGGVLLSTMLWTHCGLREKPWSPKNPADAKVKLRHVFDIRLKDAPNFRLLTLSRFFFNAGFYTAVYFITFYLRDSIGLGDGYLKSAFILFEIVTFAGVIGTFMVARNADRHSKKSIIFMCSGLLCAAAIAFLLVSDFRAVMLLGVLFGIAWGAFAAVDWALAANLVPKADEAGRYMAIWHISMTLPQVVAPMIAGPVADVLNRYSPGLGWRAVFAFIPVYVLAGAALLRKLDEAPVQQVESESMRVQPQ